MLDNFLVHRTIQKFLIIHFFMKYPFSKKIIFIFGTIGSCLLFEKHFIKNYFKSNENNCNPDYKKVCYVSSLPECSWKPKIFFLDFLFKIAIWKI